MLCKRMFYKLFKRTTNLTTAVTETRAIMKRDSIDFMYSKDQWYMVQGGFVSSTASPHTCTKD